MLVEIPGEWEEQRNGGSCLCRIGEGVMKLVIAIMLATSMAGCASEAEVKARMAAINDGKCKGYGAQPATPAYVQCRAQLDAARTQAIATMAATPGPPVYTPAPIVVPPMPR